MMCAPRNLFAPFSQPPVALALGRRLLALVTDIVYSHRLTRAATERLRELVGAMFVYDTSPLQPLIRDIQTCLTHSVANFDAAMVPYGRSMLGMEAMPPV